MSQTTRRGISEKVKSLRESDVLPFHEILDVSMVQNALKEEGVSFSERIYTPLVTLCLFLSQVLDPDHSCRAAVARLIVWLSLNRRRPCAPDTGAYCDARQRLPVGVVARLVRQTARDCDARAAASWLWKGRHVVLVDGTTASMPDTEANQKTYPQSRSQKRGLGFPIVHLVALISLATGVVRDLALGPGRGKKTGETALFRKLWDGLQPGEVVLGDRVYGSFFGIAGLEQRGVDGVFRMHQCRKVNFSDGQRLGHDDHLVTWVKPERPEWMDEKTYEQIPEQLTVRELRVALRQPGFRVHTLVLVTSLINAELYTTEELAGLYLQRWNVELDLRSIKVVMQMDVLRCKTPEMVEKEIWAHMLAYNLIRGVMARAAEAHDLLPRHVSFKGAFQTMTAFQDALRRAGAKDREVLWRTMLAAMARHEVGDRFGRVEPRANKRRPKPQRFLMVPRAEARKQLLQAA